MFYSASDMFAFIRIHNALHTKAQLKVEISKIKATIKSLRTAQKRLARRQFPFIHVFSGILFLSIGSGENTMVTPIVTSMVTPIVGHTIHVSSSIEISAEGH